MTIVVPDVIESHGHASITTGYNYGPLDKSTAPMDIKDFKLGLEVTPANVAQWFQLMELLLRTIDC